MPPSPTTGPAPSPRGGGEMPSIIDEVFAGLYGDPAWDVRKGYASNLTFEFGDPRAEVGRVREFSTPSGSGCRRRPVSVHGAWRLWIHLCDWKTSLGGRLL